MERSKVDYPRPAGTRGPRRVLLLIAFLAALLGALPAHGASITTASPTDCRFVLGFAALRDGIASLEGKDLVGQCRENQYHAPNGDGVQLAEGGLLIWRKAANWTGFTDGQSSWVSGPEGVQKRSNAERHPWEPALGVDLVGFLSAPPAGLPPLLEVDEAVRQVLVLHAANGGSTYNHYFGDLGGQRLFAVSLYPERSVLLEGKQPALELLRRFVLDNGDLLQDPRVSIGTWFDEESGRTYLDVSATIPDRQQAMELGRRYNQIAIFDLYTFEEIETGGTGEKVANMPPPSSRLPELRPGQR